VNSLQPQHYDAPHAKTFIDDMLDTGQRVQHLDRHPVMVNLPWEGPAVECRDVSFVMKSTSCQCQVMRTGKQVFVAPQITAPLNDAGNEFLAQLTR